jgi:YegS/Rv2252/BmrU family lipid kinase
MEIRLIVNPHAGGGAARRKTAQLAEYFQRAGARCTVAETERPGHATQLARQAQIDGVFRLVVVGGDGTLNEVVQVYVDENGAPAVGPELALVPAGTGGDFCRAFGLDADPAKAVARIMAAIPRPLDLALARLVGHDGRPITRAFANVGSFGISGSVARMTNQGGKWLGGRLAFYSATTRATLGYQNAPVHIVLDGESFYRGKAYLVAAANAGYFGGGMNIAPTALPTDGLLNCVLVGDVGRLEALAKTPLIYKGKHLSLAKVKSKTFRHMRAEPWLTGDDVYVELDGETPGKLPLEIQVLEGAVQLCV